MRAPRMSAGTTTSAPRTPACFSSTAVNQKVEPFPSSLTTPISPPISSASCLETASPNPVPPYLRVIEAST